MYAVIRFDTNDKCLKYDIQYCYFGYTKEIAIDTWYDRIKEE